MPDDAAGPTPERIAHAGQFFTLAGRARSSRKFTFLDDALGRALVRSVIQPAEYSALRRYALHWAAGGLGGALQSVDLDRVFALDPASMTGLPRSERQLLHREAYHAARRAIGRRPAWVADQIACHGYSLRETGTQAGYRSPYRARQKAGELLSEAGYRLQGHFEEVARRGG